MQQRPETDTAAQQAVKPPVKQQKKKQKADSAASSKGSSANQLQSVDFTTALLLSRELASTIVPSRVENAFQLDAFNMAIGLRMLDSSDWLTVSWHPQVNYCFNLSLRACFVSLYCSAQTLLLRMAFVLWYFSVPSSYSMCNSTHCINCSCCVFQLALLARYLSEAVITQLILFLALTVDTAGC
jgi:hypothetical protein